jgi:hypothetical protein
MHWFYAIVRFLPYWALPVMLLCAETGWTLRWTPKARKKQVFLWGSALFLAVISGGWFFFRGDVNSDRWVRMWIISLGLE